MIKTYDSKQRLEDVFGFLIKLPENDNIYFNDSTVWLPRDFIFDPFGKQKHYLHQEI